MSDPIIEIIRRLAKPLAPEPTGEASVLSRLEGIRAVLFDIYGTLFISASGDIVATAAREKSDAFAQAAAACGLTIPDPVTSPDSALTETIRRRHAESRAAGAEYPEVEIVSVWAETLERLGVACSDESTLRRLVVEYENRVNPVWSMPGCREMLERLRDAGLLLGLVSNAQFYTPPLFEALLSADRTELGVRRELESYSFRIGSAKPGRELFDSAAANLNALGVSPPETLYVGNDMLNDVAPAQATGFRTALFAGDRRSLRKREDDRRVAGVSPDAVLTDLFQLLPVLGIIPSEQ